MALSGVVVSFFGMFSGTCSEVRGGTNPEFGKKTNAAGDRFAGSNSSLDRFFCRLRGLVCGDFCSNSRIFSQAVYYEVLGKLGGPIGSRD